LLDDATEEEYKKLLDEVKPLEDLIQKYQPETLLEDRYFLKEFVLWGLVEYDKLSKDRVDVGYQFKDLYSSYINKL
jgi:magnesium chelatase subunit I